MGRPIKRKFFGVDNVNDGLTYSEPGGEGVSSITVTTAGSNYAQGLTATIANSTIGGDRATISSVSVYTANGAIQSATVGSAGTGYISAPVVTLIPSANVTTSVTRWSGNAAGNILTVSSTTGLQLGMHTTGVNLNQNAHIIAIYSGNSNVVMSSGNIGSVTGNVTFYDRGYLQGVGVLTAVLASTITTANTIQANAWTLTTSTIGKTADILSQRSARRYKVTNADGTSVCRLVANATVASSRGPTSVGEMTITATDSTGGTYLVKHLCSRTVTLYPLTGTQFAEDVKVAWTSTDVAIVNSGTSTAPSSLARVKIATNN